MDNRILMLMLVMTICILSEEVVGRDKTKKYFSEVDKKLKLLNKPAVRTIKTEDGDLIDCVDIYKQPAFDHPALKDHTIQMRPSLNIAEVASSATHKTSNMAATQNWRKYGSCPNGTVPIRRVRREDLLRATSLAHFGKKYFYNPSARKMASNQQQFGAINTTQAAARNPSDRNHSVAVLLTYTLSYIGASGEITVWNPHVEPGEFSSAQVWLGNNFESVQAGWMVNPELYGDWKTRLFGYWTNDSRGGPGCFDVTCAGFVQTSSEIVLGAMIDPQSSDRFNKYYIVISINIDTVSGNWWLSCNGKAVGYWPGALFTSLNQKAVFVEWGGEVFSANLGKTPHTKTAMGSGHYANEFDSGVAAMVNHPRIVDYSVVPKYPPWASTFMDDYQCYTALNYVPGRAHEIGVKADIEPEFYFGGPGGSDWHCP